MWQRLITMIVVVFFVASGVLQGANLFVTGINGVSEYTTDGTYVGNFVPMGSGGLDASLAGLRFGPDGNLYVCDSSAVKKYDGVTGDYLGDFVSSGLSSAMDILFDSAGNAYVSNYTGDSVSKFSSTGALLQTFTSGLSTPAGLSFRPNGNLLVANAYAGAYRNTITEIDTTPGAFSTFATGLGEPVGITVGPDARYYVGNYTYALAYGGTNPDTIQVVGSNGGASQTWNTGGNLYGTCFLTFADGDLFVTSYYNDQVVRFNGTTGEFISSFTGPDGVYGITTRPVPEPGTFAMLGILGVCLGGCVWRKRRRVV